MIASMHAIFSRVLCSILHHLSVKRVSHVMHNIATCSIQNTCRCFYETKKNNNHNTSRHYLLFGFHFLLLNSWMFRVCIDWLWINNSKKSKKQKKISPEPLCSLCISIVDVFNRTDLTHHCVQKLLIYSGSIFDTQTHSTNDWKFQK